MEKLDHGGTPIMQKDQNLNSAILSTSLVAQRVKLLPTMQETQVRPLGQENPLEKEIGNPLQYSCLENPMDRGSCQATVHGVAQSRTRLGDFTSLLLHSDSEVSAFSTTKVASVFCDPQLRFWREKPQLDSILTSAIYLPAV